MSKLTLGSFYLENPNNVGFELLSSETGEKLPLEITDSTITEDKNSFNIGLPDQDLKQFDFLQTKINNNETITTRKFNSHFILRDYNRTTLSNLMIIGLVLFILLLVCALLAKWKTHYLAEEANTLILHVFGFFQVIHYFQYITVHENTLFHFLEGFGFAHLSFFPSFFSSLIPSDYI